MNRMIWFHRGSANSQHKLMKKSYLLLTIRAGLCQDAVLFEGFPYIFDDRIVFQTDFFWHSSILHSYDLAMALGIGLPFLWQYDLPHII